MTLRSSDSMTLSPGQSDAVEKAADANLLIVAGAGTGKTHVMVHRLVRLISTNMNEEPTQVLLLTFTRAVARELRDRIKAQGSDARFVRSNTLDSFATAILGESGFEGELALGYDWRINKASRLLEDPDTVLSPRLQQIGHIFVDEIQDLVGPRLRMIKALLCRSDCGFTLMGDLAQAIYGEDAETKMLKEENLFDWVRRVYPELTEITFNKNYRVTGKQAEVALSVGSALRGSNPDFERLYKELRGQLCFTDIIKEYRFPPIPADIKTAFLSRTNCESLLISAELTAQGEAHTVRLRSSERALTAWVSVLLQGIDADVISEHVYSEHFDCLTNSGFNNLPDKQETWETLKRLAKARANIIKCSDISERIRLGSVPEEMSDRQDSPITVSTIHSAKGLEFDSVIVTKPDHTFVRHDNYGAAARLLFVAMSRTRDRLRFREPPDMAGWYLPRAGRNLSDPRWTKRSSAKGVGSMTAGLEIRPGDLDDDCIPFLKEGITDPIDEWQKKVLDTVTAGDEVILALNKTDDSPGGSNTVYKACHKKSMLCLGYTSAAFGDLLRSALRSGREAYPAEIRSLRVSGFETAAVNPALLVGREEKMRIWPKPIIIGLGTWETDIS